MAQTKQTHFDNTHPLNRIWDTVTKIAEEGSMSGIVSYRHDDNFCLGRMTFGLGERRYTVYVQDADKE